MSLRRIIDFVRSHEKELVLFNVGPTDPIVEDLANLLKTQNVRIRTERTTSGAPAGVAVLSTDESVLATVEVSTLRNLVETVPRNPGTTGFSDTKYDPLLGHLKETTFTSYDSEQLLYASREIEDRARRVGSGTIHAGFQRVSVVVDEQAIYTDLARRGVDVHAFGLPDGSAPDLGAGQVHAIDADEIAKTWFVVYNGNGDDTQKSALLAREYEPGRFYGAWTYDSHLVDRALTHLEETYLSPAEGKHSPASE